MNIYFVDNFVSKDIYHGFLSYMGGFSDAFSLVYFQYNHMDKPSKNVRSIMKALNEYEIYSENVTCWPGTETKNENGHIYNLAAYHITMNSIDVLERAKSLWDWDYPKYPMDLCFYKHGYAWFASSIHEHWNALYSDQLSHITDLRSIGLELIHCGTIDNNSIFYNEKLSKINKWSFYLS